MILVGLGLVVAPARARQVPATNLTALQVELWPDHDRPAMLVLMNGTLPPTAELPTTVTIPLPPGAEVNAVARMSDENQLMSDVAYTVEDNQLTITLDDHYFRAEYYAPYTANDQQRSYTFDWLSDMPVGQLSLTVQEPAAAENLTISPTAVNVSATRGDGLNYHALPSRSVAAGEEYTVTVSYDTPTDDLTALSSSAESPLSAGAATPDTTRGLLLALGAVALALGGWYLVRRSRSSSGHPPKPSPVRPPKPTPTAVAERYCHQCGQQAEEGDQFCRNCGTALK